MKTTSFTCVLIGEQSLLLRCAESLLDRDHGIELVVSANSDIENWCGNRGIRILSPSADYASELSQTEFDFLFSITNLRVLPDAVIKLPKQAAINFHDGPLPRYAGLNAPVWALLNGETEYGITWHLMTAQVDHGGILKQKTFSMQTEDTAFSLNAKCYEAGAETFDELVEDLAGGTLKPVKQDGKPDIYGRDRRPAAACLIDWTQPAHKIMALIRATNYGPYFNPIGKAKVFLGNSVGLVQSAEIVTDERFEGDPLPGSILEIDVDGQSITVGCSDKAIRINELHTQSGQKLDLAEVARTNPVEDGKVIPSLVDESRLAITEINSRICVHDEFWVRQLNSAAPVSIPGQACELDSAGSPGEFKRYDIPLAHDISNLAGNGESKDSAVVALTVLLMGRLNDGLATFNIAYTNPRLRGLSREEALIFSNWIPLNVEIDFDSDFKTLVQHVAGQLELLDQKFSFSRDLFSRSPELHETSDCGEYPVGIVTGIDPDEFSYTGDSGQAQIFVIGNKQVTLFHRQASEQSFSVAKLAEVFEALSGSINAEPGTPLSRHDLVSGVEKERLLRGFDGGSISESELFLVHEAFERQVEQNPDAVAISFKSRDLSYSELNQKANQLAFLLRDKGVAAEDRVAVLVDRSIDMVVCLFAVLKAGCAYVPLDPTYPVDRLLYMIDDCRAARVVTSRTYVANLKHCDDRLVVLEDEEEELEKQRTDNPTLDQENTSLAYLIYTSGSTGKPKGVMVEHRNVASFMLAMDDRIGPEAGVWLAVTSISFDISVLELFWTLSRGFKVVLYADELGQADPGATGNRHVQAMDFSLFYWNVASDESEYDAEKYRLLLESAKYADQNQFCALWTPERHFGAFGGLYPNPSVTSAALSTITKQIKLRGGSCVVPLHSPIRIAEEWAVVDNLSNGRVGISIAAGWAAPDFAIIPDNFANAKDIMFESAETVRRLWRGETIEMPGPNSPIPVRTLPRPIQPELPIWVTTAGNIDTFLRAAEFGGNILTHLLGQTIEEVAEKITAYKKAWKEFGHPGEGKVSLLIHTFVGSDQATVKDLVREPMKNYLKSAMFLVKSAAWQFPTIKKVTEEQGKTLDEYFDNISDEDLDALLEFAFERYFETSGLFGTPESCMAMVEKLRANGIDEIGCLIDFGMETDVVLDNLPNLNELRKLNGAGNGSKELSNDDDIPALIEKHKVTHLQCTPSMATMLSLDPECKTALAGLEQLLVGGEAFPPELANQLYQMKGPRVMNMYGPTETTIWSSTEIVDETQGTAVSIGKPIAGTRVQILDRNLQLMPEGVPGEIVIGGMGVVRGYFERGELTREKFVPDIFTAGSDCRLYRTGDLGLFRPEGKLEYLGRMDQQVKMRGYRIELGEIEAVLREHDSVRECAVILREDRPGDQRLVAFLTPAIGKTLVPTQLRRHIARVLPDFMVPASFVSLDRLPLTLNGKVDRKALAEKQVTGKTEYRVVEPDTEAEKYLTSLWGSLLESDHVSTTDNFFEVGGHSLLAAQVVAQVRKETGIAIPLASMVVNTLGQIAAQKFPAEWQPKGFDEDSEKTRPGSFESKGYLGSLLGKLKR